MPWLRKVKSAQESVFRWVETARPCFSSSKIFNSHTQQHIKYLKTIMSTFIFPCKLKYFKTKEQISYFNCWRGLKCINDWLGVPNTLFYASLWRQSISWCAQLIWKAMQALWFLWSTKYFRFGPGNSTRNITLQLDFFCVWQNYFLSWVLINHVAVICSNVLTISACKISMN